MPVISGTAASAGVPSELVVRADASGGGQGVSGRKQSGAAIRATGRKLRMEKEECRRLWIFEPAK